MALTMLLYALGDLQFPLQMMALNACTPYRTILGAVNGLSMSLGSLARALGPWAIKYVFVPLSLLAFQCFARSSLYSASVQADRSHIVWLVIVPITALFGCQSFLVQFHDQRKLLD
jgi:hypothetical protein